MRKCGGPGVAHPCSKGCFGDFISTALFYAVLCVLLMERDLSEYTRLRYLRKFHFHFVRVKRTISPIVHLRVVFHDPCYFANELLQKFHREKLRTNYINPQHCQLL